MPHCRKRAAAPDVMAADALEPLKLTYEPAGPGPVTETPGAAKSGLISPSRVKPRPDSGEKLLFAA